MPGLHVGPQITRLGSLVKAELTLKGLVARVPRHVGCQMTFVPSYGYLTDLALKPYALAMDLDSVPLELVLVTQHCVTEGASYWASAVGSGEDPDLERGNSLLRGIRLGLGLS